MKATNMKKLSNQVCQALVLGCVFFPIRICLGQELNNGTRPTPLTRPDLKQLIEDVKLRVPRIPLPELTAVDREKLGDQVDSYESRIRHHYLNGIEPNRSVVVPQTAPSARGPRSGQPAITSREQDPAYSLDSAFKVELFWIVSRVNNCQYCIGHQETKLLGAGRSEDQIASLDGDWSELEPAKQLAFAFARKFTYQPHLISDGDIVGLKAHYSDNQILEMILSMSGNNSINRWKEGIGVPQRKEEGGYSRLATLGQNGQGASESDPKLPRGTYLTPTSAAFAKKVSKVAVFSLDEKSGEPICLTQSKRPPLESRDLVEKMLSDCRTRKSRLGLVDEAQARRDIPGCASTEGALPNWVRLIANFPKGGASRFESFRAADEKGDLSPLFKAQLNWILARQDRAWYALGLARTQLQGLGQTEEQIFALDGDWSPFSARDRALFQLACQLATSPVVLSDEEVKRGVQLAGPRDVVQTISYTTSRASFNRLTEAAGLPL